VRLCSVQQIRGRRFAKEAIAVPGDDPIDPHREALGERNSKAPLHQPAARQVGGKGKKCLKPLKHFSGRSDQKRHVWTAGAIALPQGLFGLIALVWDESDVGCGLPYPGAFESVLGGHTQLALAVVDQETMLLESLILRPIITRHDARSVTLSLNRQQGAIAVAHTPVYSF